MNFPFSWDQKSHIPRRSREEFLSFNMSGSRGTGINLSGISDLTPGYVMNRKNCSFSILICVLEGSGVMRNSEGEMPLKEGEIYFEEAGRDQFYGTVGDWKILWFHLDPSVWTDLDTPFFVHRRPEQTASLFDMARTYQRESRSEGDRSILYSLEEIITQMINRLLTRPYSQDSRSRDKRVTDKLRRRINRHISRDWTVEELSEITDITPSYLYKITARSLGITPQGLVRKIKMDVARHLLTHSDYPLKFIAERIGYTTPYAFSKSFKKMYGVSPGEFRKQNQG
jgi:AraC-like DNA-binding protein